MDDWRLPIVELVAIKSAIYRIDQGRLWTYALPRVKATEDELRACESRLGRPLDPQYRSFLGFANGWPAFIQPDDLLGTQELGVDRHWQLGMDVLATYRDDELRQRGLPPGSLLMPIAVSLYHSAGFFMERNVTPGRVVWLTTELVDVFDSFDSFFLSMIEYNRRELKLLETDENLRREVARLPRPWLPGVSRQVVDREVLRVVAGIQDPTRPIRWAW